MTVKAYLAGPDVFLPDAALHARRKVEICARYRIVGRPPLNEDIEGLAAMCTEDAWRAIFRKDVAMMEDCDIISLRFAALRPMPARWLRLAGFSGAAGRFSAIRIAPSALPSATVANATPFRISIREWLLKASACPTT